MATPTPIGRDELKALLDIGDVVLLEALPAMYYDAEHLPGALNLPHDEVDTLAPRLVPDKDAVIVVYCASQTCQNSRMAATRLIELGYRNVADYELGKQDWIEAGLPVEHTVSA